MSCNVTAALPPQPCCSAKQLQILNLQCNLPRAGRREVAMETSVIKHRESTRHPRRCAVRAAARVTASIQTNSCFWPRRLEKNRAVAPWGEEKLQDNIRDRSHTLTHSHRTQRNAIHASSVRGDLCVRVLIGGARVGVRESTALSLFLRHALVQTNRLLICFDTKRGLFINTRIPLLVSIIN